MSIWTEEFKAIVARARAQAEAAGDLHPTGPTQLDLPEATRAAIAEWIRSGGYEQAAKEAAAGDPEMTQL